MLSEILNSESLVLGASGLEDLRFCCAIVTVGPHAVKLQTNAGRARPCVGSRGIALDLSSPTALTRSHDWDKQLASAVSRDGRVMFIQLGFPGAGFHTLKSFMTVMLIHEDIIWNQTNVNHRSTET